MRSDRVLFIVFILCIISPLIMAEEGRFLYARWTPSAIYPDGKSSTTLEVWTVGDVEYVTLGAAKWPHKVLHDDGKKGDRKANDGIWTVSGVTRDYYTHELIPGASLSGYDVYVTARNGEPVRTGISGLAIPLKHRHKVTKVAQNVYRTKWGAFLIDEKGDLLDGKIPVCNIRCGKGNEKVFQMFFQYFPDKFDFLVVMPFTPVFRPDDYRENVPYFVHVRNNIRNIGIPMIDRGAEFGSKKKLKGVIYHSFGYGAILDHEIGHNWGVNIGHAKGLLFSGYDCQYHETYGSHYTQYSNQVGQMAANPKLILEKNSDGTYKATTVSDIEVDNNYTPLTLYCMGLIPPEDVPPIMILRNKDYPNYNSIPKSEFDIYTIQQIMAANGGERIPAYPNTQKKFRVGFIFVADRELTQAEFDFFSQIPQYFQAKNDEGMHYLTPFHHATGGRAKLRTKMAMPLKN